MFLQLGFLFAFVCGSAFCLYSRYLMVDVVCGETRREVLDRVV